MKHVYSEIYIFAKTFIIIYFSPFLQTSSFRLTWTICSRFCPKVSNSVLNIVLNPAQYFLSSNLRLQKIKIYFNNKLERRGIESLPQTPILSTGNRSTLKFPSRVNLFRSQFVLYLALWTGLAGATRLTRSDFMLHID